MLELYATHRVLERPRPAVGGSRGGRLATLCAAVFGALCALAPGSAAAQPPPGAQGPPDARGGPFVELELELEFGTYIGGCRARQGVRDLALDGEGNAVVVGFLPSGCDRGEPDIFIRKYAPDGTLLFRNGLGGHFADIPNGVALDDEGNIYITGGTQSDLMRRPFPVVDPFQGDNAGGFDAFVTKLDPTAETILYSTFLGGSSLDVGYDIEVDDAGRIVVVGKTFSVDFPTESPFQGARGGAADAFVAVFEPDGSELVLSTYFGGVEADHATRVAVLGERIVFTGATASPDLPTRVPGRSGGLSTTYGGGASDVFVARIDRLQRLGYAGFLGGSGEDVGYDVAIDRSGSPVVAGTTDSPDFPTVRALQEEPSDPAEADAFVTHLNSSGSNARYSTYLETPGSATCPGFGDPRPPLCAAVALADDGTAFVTAEGFFALAVAKNGRALLGAHEGYGGSGIEVADDGTIFVAGVSQGFPLPLENQPHPSQSHIFLELGWIVGLTQNAEDPGPGPP